MYSTERRVDRYRALYVWKVVRGLVPNCGLTWEHAGRRGLLVRIPPLSGSRMAIRSLREKAFTTEAPRLFNALPLHLREHGGSLPSFKAALDSHLQTVPDHPVCDTRATFATNHLGQPSNSLRDWLQALGSPSYSRLLHEASQGAAISPDLALGVHPWSPPVFSSVAPLVNSEQYSVSPALPPCPSVRVWRGVTYSNTPVSPGL